jgi:hypothetical protein
LKEKERVGGKHHREAMAPPRWHRNIDFFVQEQFINCKVGKIWAVLMEELGWLVGLLNLIT